MTPERRREIASKGGRSAQSKGWAHRWTPETAQDAGRKGGLAPHTSRSPGRLTRADAIEAAWQQGISDAEFMAQRGVFSPVAGGESLHGRWWARGYEWRQQQLKEAASA